MAFRIDRNSRRGVLYIPGDSSTELGVIGHRESIGTCDAPDLAARLRFHHLDPDKTTSVRGYRDLRHMRRPSEKTYPVGTITIGMVATTEFIAILGDEAGQGLCLVANERIFPESRVSLVSIVSGRMVTRIIATGRWGKDVWGIATEGKHDDGNID